LWRRGIDVNVDFRMAKMKLLAFIPKLLQTSVILQVFDSFIEVLDLEVGRT